MKSLLIALIISGAQERGIDPNLALAIATVESNLNQRAIGSLGEVGAFQLRPQFYLNNRILVPIDEYVAISLDLIQEKINKCGLKLFPACYNLGISKARKLGVAKALNGPYTTKVRRAYKQLSKGEKEFYER